jgi:uncharacterized membrane protein YjjP (DUF1212 family)
MHAAGDATTFVRRTLERIARAYGLANVDVSVSPTLLLLRYGADRSTFIDLSTRIAGELRLDQITDVYALAEEAEQGRVTPAEGQLLLRAALSRGARFGWLLRVAGLGMIAGGVSLVLGPSFAELSLAVDLGIVVGLIKEAFGRLPPTWPLVPTVCGLLASTIAFLLAGEGADIRPLRVVIPPLATFLPGAALTVAMIELANGDLISGGSRLAYCAACLCLLVFGVVIGAEWAGIPVAEVETTDELLAPLLASAVGVVAFTIGVSLHSSAPPGTWPWLLAVVAVAWAGQELGAELLGARGPAGRATPHRLLHARLLAFGPGCDWR